MEIEMEGRKKNTLLHREELNFEILHVKKTPTRNEVRKELAAKLGATEDLVIIDDITHEFGSMHIVGFAKRYDSIEDLKKIEPSFMRKKHGEVIEVKDAKPNEAKKEA
ncbi:MAG: 30S ribosomal protein S24e [archaeon]